ncbi:hypothetical protein D3C86_1567700 [compost metagenome]
MISDLVFFQVELDQAEVIGVIDQLAGKEIRRLHGCRDLFILVPGCFFFEILCDPVDVFQNAEIGFRNSCGKQFFRKGFEPGFHVVPVIISRINDLVIETFSRHPQVVNHFLGVFRIGAEGAFGNAGNVFNFPGKDR